MSGISKKYTIFFQPIIIGIFFIGFASGLPLALSSSTLSIWLTESKTSIDVIGLFTLLTIPYTLRFLWAPMVDYINIPYLTNKLGIRRSWLIVTQLILIIMIILLGKCDPVNHIIVMALVTLIMVFFATTQDILVDAYRIEILNKDQQAAGASMYVTGYRLGFLFSSAGSLYISSKFSWSIAYSSCAAGILLGTIAISLLPEPNLNAQDKSSNYPYKKTIFSLIIQRMINSLQDFTKRKHWVIIILFIIFFKLGDVIAGIMTNSFLINIGFSKTEIATIVKSFGLATSMVGAVIGGAIILKYGIIKGLWITGILQMLTNIMFVLQAYVGYHTTLLILSVGAENLAAGMVSAVFVTYLSNLCNLSYTATQYAILNAISSIGRILIGGSAGFIVKQLGWLNFFVFTTLAALPGLVFLYIYTAQLMRDNIGNNATT